MQVYICEDLDECYIIRDTRIGLYNKYTIIIIDELLRNFDFNINTKLLVKLYMSQATLQSFYMHNRTYSPLPQKILSEGYH